MTAAAVAFGGGGLFAASTASSPASPVVTIDPVRILDAWTGIGLAGQFQSRESRKLQVTGAVVRAGSTGVLLNLTVATPSADGFLSLRPTRLVAPSLPGRSLWMSSVRIVG